MTSVAIFLSFFAIVVIYSLWRGGAPERVVAVGFVAALGGSALEGVFQMPGQFRVVPIHLLVVDTLLLAGLAVIAIRANRWWPIPVAGCQLVAVLVHAAKFLSPEMIPNGYAFLTTIWSWPMTALLAAGTWNNRRRVKAGHIVPGWKPI